MQSRYEAGGTQKGRKRIPLEWTHIADQLFENASRKKQPRIADAISRCKAEQRTLIRTLIRCHFTSWADSSGGVTTPIRRRMSCCRRMSRAVGRAGLSTRGLVITADSSADSDAARSAARL